VELASVVESEMASEAAVDAAVEVILVEEKAAKSAQTRHGVNAIV
jgi:hypothetical protein